MATQKQILFSLLLFEFALFPLVATTVSMPGIRNPILDILPSASSNASPFGVAGGTIQSNADTVSQQQQQVQSCGMGGIIGGGIGLLGFVLGPVGIVTTIGGAVLGCAVAGSFFPQQGSQAFQQVTNALGPIGDFVKAIIVVLAYIGPIISFSSDAINYEIALFLSAPEVGFFLFPLQAITIIWIFWEMASYFRGIGSLV